MSRSAASVAAWTAGTALVGLLGYAVYFDYQRRNNPDFRKSLRKQQKQIQHAAEARSKAEKEKNSKALRAALIEINQEIPPSSPEQQEAYFQEQVAEGEKLAALGPDQYVESAKHFFRALRVYPQPVELLMIYQKVVPPPVFALLLELTSAAGEAPSAPASGPVPIPPQPAASVADIDEASLESPNGQSQGSGSGFGSGNEWENVNEGN
ncbi:MAS20 protein import receptor-domain-containing protein [Papiliotrema laurentii]|uniref:MAS20 protein import receptor-domain-containing protein n=1 Tax=Papiliotrema laurentii TaxID=5418 RepID=A0AAD9L9C5_PAPLA|nr:MAS20 protein import receptor-domain-containing protein [Papiliotrema laurentii]